MSYDAESARYCSKGVAELLSCDATYCSEEVARSMSCDSGVIPKVHPIVQGQCGVDVF